VVVDGECGIEEQDTRTCYTHTDLVTDQVAAAGMPTACMPIAFAPRLSSLRRPLPNTLPLASLSIPCAAAPYPRCRRRVVRAWLLSVAQLAGCNVSRLISHLIIKT
jgi:hypothetical protein